LGKKQRVAAPKAGHSIKLQRQQNLVVRLCKSGKLPHLTSLGISFEDNKGAA